MPVHHVKMDQVDARSFDRANFVAEAGEIGGEN